MQALKFVTTILYEFLISHIRATCPDYLILLHSIGIIGYCLVKLQNMQLSSSTCSLRSLCLFLLGKNILPTSLFSLSPHSSVQIRVFLTYGMFNFHRNSYLLLAYFASGGK
jgi:hypothetical protein